MSETKARKQKSGNGDDRGAGSGADIIEWVLGVVSAAIVLGIVSFLLYQALAVSRPAPDLEVTSETIEQRSGAYYVEFRALNRGEATAAGVSVEGKLMNGERSVETSETTLDYVPSQSERRGALLFRNDPRGYRLLLEAKGYQEP